MVKHTKEHKHFISKLYLEDKKKGKEIISLFNEKFGFMPSASAINKYLYYNVKMEDDKGRVKEKKEKKLEDLEIVIQDTKKLKGIIDFSSGDIEDEDFDKICEAIRKSQAETFDLLQKSLKKGYKKINLETGEVTK